MLLLHRKILRRRHAERARGFPVLRVGDFACQIEKRKVVEAMDKNSLVYGLPPPPIAP